MLTLAQIGEKQRFSIRVGEYLPLTLESESRVLSLDEIYYWRSTNSDYLLEIKIIACTGALSEIELVLLPQQRFVNLHSLDQLFAVNEEKVGLPHFQLFPWNHGLEGKEVIDPLRRRYDEQRPFNYFIANDGVVLLFDGYRPEYSITSYQIQFLFTHAHELCGVAVKDKQIAEEANKVFK
jgi:hypothetical protein